MPYSSIAVDSGCGQNPLVKQDPPQPPFKRGEPGKSPPVSPPVGGKQGGIKGVLQIYLTLALPQHQQLLLTAPVDS